VSDFASPSSGPQVPAVCRAGCATVPTEAVFEGEPRDVDALVDFCRRGPRGADVERVEVEAELPEGLAGFRVTG
jgi:hypothetical protein